MKLFSIGETEIRCSPLLLMLIPAAVVFGREGLLAAAFLSLSVHEAAHAIMAARLGFRPERIEIQPFGFVARTDLRAASAGERAFIYAAGPAASVMLAAFSALAGELIPAYSAASLGLTEYNLLICAVNLLPALPLDGGRLIYSAVMDRGRKPALRALRVMGALTGAAFLAAFGLLLANGFVNPTFAVMGAFLIAAALREKEPAFFTRHKRICAGRALPVRFFAAPQEATVAEAYSLLPAGSYAVLSVLDGAGRRLGELDEYALSQAASALGASATLKDAVEITRRGML